MLPIHEKPLEVVIGMRLRRTDVQVVGPNATKLNAMTGIYSITETHPTEVLLQNINETRAAVEGRICLRKIEITPTRFLELQPGE